MQKYVMPEVGIFLSKMSQSKLEDINFQAEQFLNSIEI
jgi:hypothetical protein